MKVKKLIEKLEKYDGEIEVALVCKAQFFEENRIITDKINFSEENDINGDKVLILEEMEM